MEISTPWLHCAEKEGKKLQILILMLEQHPQLALAKFTFSNPCELLHNPATIFPSMT